MQSIARILLPTTPRLMPGWVSQVEGVTPGIHIPIIIKQIRRVRHERIRADELAQFGVIGSAGSPTVEGVEVLQTGGVESLAGETVLRTQFTAAAAETIGVVTFIGQRCAAAIGG